FPGRRILIPPARQPIPFPTALCIWRFCRNPRHPLHSYPNQRTVTCPQKKRTPLTNREAYSYPSILERKLTHERKTLAIQSTLVPPHGFSAARRLRPAA